MRQHPRRIRQYRGRASSPGVARPGMICRPNSRACCAIVSPAAAAAGSRLNNSVKETAETAKIEGRPDVAKLLRHFRDPRAQRGGHRPCVLRCANSALL